LDARSSRLRGFIPTDSCMNNSPGWRIVTIRSDKALRRRRQHGAVLSGLTGPGLTGRMMQ
jgi:hypothetical protein